MASRKSSSAHASRDRVASERPRTSVQDEPLGGASVVPHETTNDSNSNSTARGRAFRARRQAHEASLRARIRALRLQIADLQCRRTVWHARLLFSQRSDTGSLARLVRHYYTLFRFGMATPRDDMDEPARRFMMQQQSFASQVIHAYAETGETRGPESSMNQWRLYRAAHASFRGELGALEVTGPDDTPMVVLHSKYHVRLSRATFQIMFPQAVANEPLVQKFLHTPVVYDCVSRFRFTREGQIDYEVVDVGIVPALVRAGFCAGDVAELFQQAALSPQCTIREPPTKTKASKGTSRKANQATADAA